jgi:protein-L-isoaspartate(D-aspartate) O-methyltransferase
MSRHNADAVAAARARMLDLLRRQIRDDRVIDAMAAVRRERFVPDDLQASAYDDAALPIGHGQTISQPLMVAIMVEALDLRPTDRVLEVGTGSGYHAAVLARLAAEVVSIERDRDLLERARSLLAGEAPNVRVFAAGDMLGRAEGAPYDAIRTSHGVELQDLGPCGFVPLVGAEGWDEATLDRTRRFKV